jgi:hypothetical protein
MNALWGHKTMPEDRHKHLIEETEATISETRRLLLFFRTAQEQALEKLERLEAVLARLKKEAEEQRLEEVGR